MNETRNSEYDRRWWVLGVIALASLMVVLDATIVNVALPSAQMALHFSTDSRQWVVTAYALAFGALLLVGGRIGDYFGRKWTFIGGALGFAVASAVGGAAQSFEMLIAARAAQGAFAALLAPSALGMLTTTFTDGAERDKAFAVYSAIAASGSAIGLLLGGVLTQLLSWRYCLFVNLAFAIPAAIGGWLLLVNEGEEDRPRMDLPGTLTGPGGLFCLVYGVSYAETHSWASTLTISMLAAAGVLLAVFLAIESRVSHPLLPLRVLTNRARAGSYVGLGLAGATLLGSMLFLTYYLQRTLNYSPILTGVAFLPVAGTVAVTAVITNIKLRDRFGPRLLLVLGPALGAVGLVWLARLTPTSSYAGGVVPGMVLLGIGMGLIMGSAVATATYGLEHEDAGVGSAMVNTMQQVCGAAATALLSTIFASAMTSYLHGRPHTPQVAGAASVHGYSVAFYVCAAIFAGGAIVLAFLVPALTTHTGSDVPPPEEPEPWTEPRAELTIGAGRA